MTTPTPFASLAAHHASHSSIHGAGLAIIGMAFLVAAAGYNPDLRFDQATETFVSTLATKYGMTLPPSIFSQPMPVQEVVAFVKNTDSLAAAGLLSETEKRDLAALRAWVSEKTGCYSWYRPDSSVEGHVTLSLLGSARGGYDTRSHLHARGTAVPGMTASLGVMSVWSQVDVSTDYSYDSLFHPSTYEPYDGVPYNVYGRAQQSHVRSTDMLRGGISFDLPRLRLETAVDYLKLGPAVFNPVTLSGQTPPITYAEGKLDLSVARYTQVAGLLRADRYKDKFLYMHRLEFPLNKWKTTFAIDEVVVTGSTIAQPGPDAPGTDSLRPEYYGQTRNWEWVYMIPFVPYSFAEHYIGDRDNKFVSLDFSTNNPTGFRWYGELLLDDITTPWTILSNDWGNKWAFTVGVEYAASLMAHDLTAVAEYCRVEPWVYTHFYGESHRYTNFGECLGAPLGPNSDALQIHGNLRLTRCQTIGVTLDNFRTDTSARGGKITDVFQDFRADSSLNDSPIKHFLGAGTVRSTRLGASWALAPFGIFRMNIWCGYDLGDTRGFLFSSSGGFVF